MTGADDCAPGTVAVATVRGVPNVRVFLTVAGQTWTTATPVNGHHLAGCDEVTNVRPLVVLDPVNLGDVAFIVRGLRTSGFNIIAEQIEAQTRTKPDEPTGLGAVVKDRKGDRWVRTDRFVAGCRWRKADPVYATTHHLFADIDAVEVLSEGIA